MRQVVPLVMYQRAGTTTSPAMMVERGAIVLLEAIHFLPKNGCCSVEWPKVGPWPSFVKMVSCGKELLLFHDRSPSLLLALPSDQLPFHGKVSLTLSKGIFFHTQKNSFHGTTTSTLCKSSMRNGNYFCEMTTFLHLNL